jgi:heterodisulfide reductase subunit A-like polyferredoxin
MTVGTEDVHGSVVVIGGGISGMQSALNLADEGHCIYLIERLPSIGSAMAQMEKTIATNDCAM